MPNLSAQKFPPLHNSPKNRIIVQSRSTQKKSDDGTGLGFRTPVQCCPLPSSNSLSPGPLRRRGRGKGANLAGHRGPSVGVNTPTFLGCPKKLPSTARRGNGAGGSRICRSPRPSSPFAPRGRRVGDRGCLARLRRHARPQKRDAKKVPRATRASARCCNKLENWASAPSNFRLESGYALSMGCVAWNACREKGKFLRSLRFEAPNPFP